MNTTEKLKEIFNVFSDISAIQAHYDFMIKEKDLIVFSDKKVIPADLIMILSENFRFVGVSISENTLKISFNFSVVFIFYQYYIS